MRRCSWHLYPWRLGVRHYIWFTAAGDVMHYTYYNLGPLLISSRTVNRDES